MSDEARAGSDSGTSPGTGPGTCSGTNPGTSAGASAKTGKVLRGVVLALASGVCFGMSGTVSKFLMDTYALDPLWLASVRQIGSCLLFLLASFMVSRGEVRRAVGRPRVLGTMVVLGLAGVLMSQVGYLEAIDATNSATATVLENSSLLFLLAYTCLTRRKLPFPRELVGVILALAGIFLLATGGDPASMVVPLVGIVWGLVAGFASALITIMPGSRLDGWSSLVVNAFAMLAGGLVLVPIVQPWRELVALDTRGIVMVLFVVAIGTFGAYALYVQASKDVGPMRTALLAAVEPIVALVSSAVWLGQVFTIPDLLGMGLIMAMVFLVTR